MYDVLLSNFKALEKTSKILERLSLRPKDYYLATIHRAENTNSKHRLSEIIAAFCGLDKEVIFPAHPRTRKMLQAFGIEVDSRVRLIDPVSYVDMLTLEMNAARVLTDSGGVQKESRILGTPCVTIRNETEWPETLEGGWNVLAGADKKRIISCALTFMQTTDAGAKARIKLYGDGDAARRLVDVLLTNPEMC
jgi:UDP-N-acetylglucosamine 2-epimerase